MMTGINTIKCEVIQASNRNSVFTVQKEIKTLFNKWVDDNGDCNIILTHPPTIEIKKELVNNTYIYYGSIIFFYLKSKRGSQK